MRYRNIFCHNLILNVFQVTYLLFGYPTANSFLGIYQNHTMNHISLLVHTYYLTRPLSTSSHIISHNQFYPTDFPNSTLHLAAT